jgi:hypothetical protein
MGRFHSLSEALASVEAGAVTPGSRIVVSWTWWDALSEAERDGYRARCAAYGVNLNADHRISRHFVEIADSGDPPLSSEQRT